MKYKEINKLSKEYFDYVGGVFDTSDYNHLNFGNIFTTINYENFNTR